MDDEGKQAGENPCESQRDLASKLKAGEESRPSSTRDGTGMHWLARSGALRAIGPANDQIAGTPALERAGMRQAARTLQLSSGVVLWLYISIHMVNHALGIWSTDIAERALTLAIGLWQSLPGTIVLYGAAGLHFALAIRTIYSRRHWALPPAEWLRLWAGLSLPMLLIRHVVGTRVATSFYGFEPNYERVIVSLLTSGTQGLQIALLAPGWVHGSLGLWFHLRRHALLRRAKFVLLAVLVLLPVLSAAGFVQMARAIVPGHLAVPAPDAVLVAHRTALDSWRHLLVIGYLSLIATAFAGGQLRNRIFRGDAHDVPSAQR
ncbi:hypothetical protein [Burkholderia sp. PU8-34]